MWHETGHIGRFGDEGLADLATRQGGVVSIGQLRDLGISADAARKRAAKGTLHRIHRGVYAVGHSVLTRRGRLFAAVLAGGPGAVLSHRSAADLHDLLSFHGATHHVTAPHHRRPGGLVVHRGRLHPSEVTEIEGLPVTTVARTLLDLAEVVTPRRLERAFDQAEVLRTLSYPALDAVLARAHGRAGLRTIRDVLSTHQPGTTITRSELEERFLALTRAARFPVPQINAKVEDLEVDFHWPEARLVVELDGAATHLTHRAFKQDRRRNAILISAGWYPLRFTWEEVTGEQAYVVHTLRSRLRNLSQNAMNRA